MTTEPQKVEAEEAAAEPYDTSDKAAVNKQRKRAAARRRQQLEMIATVMGSPGGRAWMYDVLLLCNATSTPYSQSSPYDTAFQCGQQNVGLKLLADMQAAAPQEYLLMLKENN